MLCLNIQHFIIWWTHLLKARNWFIITILLIFSIEDLHRELLQEKESKVKIYTSAIRKILRRKRFHSQKATITTASLRLRVSKGSKMLQAEVWCVTKWTARINCLELWGRHGFVHKDSFTAVFGKKSRGEKVSIYKLASKDNLCDNIKPQSKNVREISILSILPSNFNKIKIKILTWFFNLITWIYDKSIAMIKTLIGMHRHTCAHMEDKGQPCFCQKRSLSNTERTN